MSDFKYFLILAIIGFIITKIATKNTKHEIHEVETETSNNFTVKWFVGIAFILAFGLFMSLSFHFIPSRGKMFPKENLSLSYTVIDEADISRLIYRYNNASLFEQASIRTEPLTRKLMEYGIIYDIKNNDENSKDN